MRGIDEATHETPLTDVITKGTFNAIGASIIELSHPHPSCQGAGDLNLCQLADQHRLRLRRQQRLNLVTGLLLPVVRQQRAGVEIKHQ